MRDGKKETPENNLRAIDEILNITHKHNKSIALTFLIIDYAFLYKKGTYKNNEKTLKIYKRYYEKIKPNFGDFLKINLPFKFWYFSFKKSIKHID